MFHVHECLACIMQMYCLHACCPWKPEEDTDSPGNGALNGSEQPCGHWGLKPGPLQEHGVLLTAEPSPQHSNSNFLKQELKITESTCRMIATESVYEEI